MSALTLREAREVYFRTSDTTEEAQYKSRYYVTKPGGAVALAFPNTPSRVEAARIHHLHHTVTGYGINFLGEAELAAWELASGSRGFRATALALIGVMGIFIYPRRVSAAYARGRRSRNLNGVPLSESFLARNFEEVRRELGLDKPPTRSAGDIVQVVGWGLLSVAFNIVIWMFAPVLIATLIVGFVLARRVRATAPVQDAPR